MTSNNKSGNGLSLTAVLLIVFLVLKLTNNINWPWYWVLSPIWLPFALVIGLIFIAFLIIVIAIIFGASIEDIKTNTDKIRNKLK